MTCRILQANGRQWRFCPDDPPPEAGFTQRIAFAVLFDDLVLGPPQTAVSVASSRPEFTGVSGPDGRVGVVGQPFPALPPAQVPGTPVGMTLEAPGYAPLVLSGALGPQPGYPTAFAPLDLGSWRLQRKATAVWGRVTRLAGGVAQPVAGAAVAVTAAVPAPAAAGTQPPPPNAASFLALTTVTDAAGGYRLGPIARAVRLTMTATDLGGTVSAAIDLDYAQQVNLLDLLLP
jgi:hypothetical protein